MALKILLNRLSSRRVRASLTQNTNVSTIGGLREVNSEGNFLGRIITGLGDVFFGVVGFIGKAIGGIAFSFVGLFNLLNRLRLFLINFNWNITDDQIAARIEGLNRAFISQLGGFAGVTAGWLVCGIVPSAGIFVFNEPLGLYLLQRVGEEALDEISGEFASLIRSAFNNLATRLFYTIFKSTRKWIKQYFKNPNSSQSQLARRIFGSNFNRIVEAWGEEGSEPYIISDEIEERIDSIENTYLRDFTEEFVDEFEDSCVEAGYVFASGLDAWIAQQKTLEEKSQNQDQQEVIEVIPDRSNERDKFLLSGKQSIILEKLPYELSQHKRFGDRAIGTVFVDDDINQGRRKPFDFGITVKFLMASVENPPIYGYKKAVITVHDVERSKLDFDTLKRAVGGRNGYNSGKFFCSAETTNGKMIKLWAGSVSEGENRISDLIKLTNYEILRYKTPVSSNNQLSNQVRREITRVYPIQVTIIYKALNIVERYRRRIEDESEIFREITLPLWREQQPSNWNEKINNLFLITQPNL